MKILFVGQLADGQTTKMRMEVLQDIGNAIIPYNSLSIWNSTSWLSRRIQQRLNIGPALDKLNRDILRLVKENRPDLFWGEKQEYLTPETIVEMQRMGIRTLHFTPDPYFTLAWKRTQLMDACMPLFDYVITSKTYEIDDYKRHCKKVIYMPFKVDPFVKTEIGRKIESQFSFL